MPYSEQSPRPPGILRQESQDASTLSASPRTYLGGQVAQSPKGSPKSVSINPQGEVMSPLLLGEQKSVDELDLDSVHRSRNNSLAKKSRRRLLGRRAPSAGTPTLRAKHVQHEVAVDTARKDSSDSRSQSRHSGHHLEHLINQVSAWIKEERTKGAERKAKHHLFSFERDGAGAEPGNNPSNHLLGTAVAAQGPAESFDLDKLESIIKENLKLERRSSYSRDRGRSFLHRKGSLRKQRKPSSASSDTDHFENDVIVPSSEVWLDNSKTLSYTGGASDDSGVSSSDGLERSTSYRDRDEWSKFKFEIVRLSHTLRLRGWRKVPMGMSDEITVQRLSGALTNAVYVVTPPMNLPPPPNWEDNDAITPASRNPPPKLLLRIYGAQVDHLIDREAELAILRRLARKQIGPRLLGTFGNGRFEEYLYAKPLTPEDLRNPETSRQIAKRMRELHDGIELLAKERDAGPFVWQNWDKWVPRVQKVVSWLDSQIAQMQPGEKPTGSEAWKRRGFICGVPWNQFKDMVDKYRAWLYLKYGGLEHIREQLVFSHNDTQYGNILRLMPTGDSPLLLPANTHKQLVVIDFEYSNANLPGLEFANHFTEWCYNYHDSRKPYAFHPNWYPTPEEQERLIRAYVRHKPQFNISTPNLTPTTPSANGNASIEPLSRKSTSSISQFMLDVRTPSVGSSNQEEAAHKAAEDQEVARLVRETRLWRLANTAMWVAWGIVQAKVPGMPDFGSQARAKPGSPDEEVSREDLGERSDEYKELVAEQQSEAADCSENQEVEEEFDYLGYAQHRAMFFWADAVQFGFMTAEELPGDLREKLKKVPY